MAAMHYSWLCGSYKEIEETYLFHKLEIIRTVNESISKSSPMAQTGIVEAISQLSMAEVCHLLPSWILILARNLLIRAILQAGVGEVSASQVHLDGLVMVYNSGEPRDRQRYQAYWTLQQHMMLM